MAHEVRRIQFPPVVSDAVMVVERHLPARAEAFIEVGQSVTPDDPIAHVRRTPPLHRLAVARHLGIDPSDLPGALDVEIGDTIEEGTILARAGWPIARIFRAPFPGVIGAIDDITGYLTIVGRPSISDITARVRGTIVEHSPAGVRIESVAAHVMGAFAIGRECSGPLRIAARQAGDHLDVGSIDEQCRGTLIVGGSGVSAAAVRAARLLGARGIIVGGIDAGVLAELLGVRFVDIRDIARGVCRLSGDGDPFTLIVVEGFGERAMMQAAFDVLTLHHRHDTFVDVPMPSAGEPGRPRIIIPLAARTAMTRPNTQRAALRQGAVVRLLNPEHLGMQARVRAVPIQPGRSGARVRTALVHLVCDDGSMLTVPQSAIEVIG
jgi:hypothetical protein